MDHETNPKRNDIKRICQSLLNEGKTEFYDNAILLEIIKEKKCDLATAEIILSDMLKSGLIACGRTYDILEFSLLRDYFTNGELETILKITKIPLNAKLGGR